MSSAWWASPAVSSMAVLTSLGRDAKTYSRNSSSRLTAAIRVRSEIGRVAEVGRSHLAAGAGGAPGRSRQVAVRLGARVGRRPHAAAQVDALDGEGTRP